MSEWVGIDDAPPAPTRLVSRQRLPPPSFVLRRHQRPVLGAIDEAGVVLRDHPRAMLVGGGVFLVPVVAMSVGVSALAFDRFESLSDAVVSVPELFSGVEAATGVETVLAYLGVVFTALAAALVGGLATAVSLAHARGERPTTRAALRATLRRVHALLGAWAVGHSWVLLVALLVTTVRGDALVGWLFFALPAGGLVATFTLFVSPAVVAERLGPVAAVARSARLVQRRFGVAVGLFAATVVLGGGLRLGIATLPRLATETGLVTFGPYGWLVEGIAGQLAQLVAVPFVAVATAQCYLQVRMHAEGLDLTVAADAAFPA